MERANEKLTLFLKTQLNMKFKTNTLNFLITCLAALIAKKLNPINDLFLAL